MELTEAGLKDILARMGTEKGKDQPRLPREMQTRIATLAAKITSEECEEKITKVLGSGWKSSPTVRMELTEAGLKDILARMGPQDTRSKLEHTPRIRGGGLDDPPQDKVIASAELPSAELPSVESVPWKLLADFNFACFSKVLDDLVEEMYNNWKAGTPAGDLPSYKKLGGDRIPDIFVDYVEFAMLYRSVRKLKKEYPGSINVLHKYNTKKSSKSQTVTIDVQVLAEAAIGVAGIPHEGLTLLLKSILSPIEGKADLFELNEDTDEAFCALNLPPTIPTDTPGAEIDRVTLSYSGVLLTSSMNSVNCFDVLTGRNSSKSMYVKSLTVALSMRKVIFPGVEIEGMIAGIDVQNVRDALYSFAVKELAKLP
jgi:hypothetical protein